MAVTTFANITAFEVPYEDGPMAAAAVLYRNAIVLRNSSGDLINGQTVAGAIGVGIADVNTMVGTNSNTWDNSAGLAGAITARYRSGRFGYFSNSGASITAGMEGKVCYCLDNVTVHATSNSGARSPAGIIYRVSSSGVIVEFDEMKVRALLAASNPSGITFTQTYSTANATVAAPTGVAVGVTLTDSTGYSGTHDDTLAASTVPVTLTDSTGYSGTHDDTLAATTLPTTLTDNSGGAGTHDDTLAAVTSPTTLLVGTLGGAADGTMEVVADTSTGDRSTQIMNNFQELFTQANLAKTAIDVLNQNSSDTAQKVMEHNTLLGVALQNISDVAQKVIEVATLLGVMAQNDSDTAQKVIEVVTLTNALVADDLDNRQSINALVDVAQAAGIAG